MLKRKGVSPKARLLYQRFLSDKDIRNRHLGIEKLDQLHRESRDEAIRRFEKVALEWVVPAAKRALEKAGLTAHDVDGLIVTTGTGYLCPGLASHIAEKTGLRENVVLFDLVSAGCGA